MGKLEKELVDAESTSLDSMISAYSRHKNTLVRRAVLDNPHISSDVIREMVQDRNNEIRLIAERRLISINKPQITQQADAVKTTFITCSECHEPTRIGDNFCRNCGNEVSISGPFCKTCEEEREEDSFFCRICGSKLLIFKSE